ncbi:MAG: hypothetical protein KC766_11360 [Myxococcales bacterium]|nr:hypothetical protein [Myxococcales bacterium]
MQKSNQGRASSGARGAGLPGAALTRSALLIALACSGCTIHHSKQALYAANEPTPEPDATFVQEEDSGLSLFGVFQIAEPDHYAVLLERARRRYRCSRIHHAQLDFFTDHWLLIAFPISRITAICDPVQGSESKGAEKR